MKPAMQRVLGPPPGDSFAACVASILELPIDRVPNFHGTGKDGTRHWVDQWRGWLAPANLGLLSMPVGTDIPPGYSILSVDSPRFVGFAHAVVCWNADPVHDPFPDSDISVHSDMGRWKRWSALVTLDPAQTVNRDALPAANRPGYQVGAWGMPMVPILGSGPGLRVRRP